MTTPTPERCPLCGCADWHDRYTEFADKCGLKNCNCAERDYLAALRGYHSRDEEIAALRAHIETFSGTLEDWESFVHERDGQIAALQADNAAKDRRIAELEESLLTQELADTLKRSISKSRTSGKRD